MGAAHEARRSRCGALPEKTGQRFGGLPALRAGPGAHRPAAPRSRHRARWSERRRGNAAHPAPGRGSAPRPGGTDRCAQGDGVLSRPRAVVVEDAADSNTAAVRAALEDWRPGDATLVLSAGSLTPRSSLRKAMEAAKNAFAIAIYADPMRRDEIEAALARENLSSISPEAMTDLEALAQSLDPGDFEQILVKLALYMRGAPGPVSSDDIAAVAPPGGRGRTDRTRRSCRRRAIAGIGASLCRPQPQCQRHGADDSGSPAFPHASCRLH